jgi:O-antigen/teichoic acid export membrane protein
MTLVATFLVNAGLSFALSLVLAALLGPDAFGRYAIGLSVAVVINTMLFEWLRLSTTRFQSERAQRETPAIRRTLDLAYWMTGAALAALTAVALAFDPPGGLSRPLIAAAAATGLAYGFCEYRMALSRALFRERSYVTLTFSRAFFGFVFSAGVAYAIGDPGLALAATALSAILPILLVQHALRAPPTSAPFDKKALARFARYALPLIAASALYQLIPLLNRSLLASRDGFVEAGYFALVSEIAIRLFQNLGAALDIVLFQLAVRADEQHGRKEAERQITRNAAIVGAIVLPAAAGLLAVWPAFEALFIPQAFRGHLDGAVPFLVPALALYALIQFSVNPFFQLHHRTGPVVAAAVAAIAVNLVAVLLWPRLSGAGGFALAQLAGLAAGFAVLLGLAIANGARLPMRDTALAATGAMVMGGAILPLRELGSPPLTLLAQVGAGGAIYGVLALAFDLCGCRTLLRNALGQVAKAPKATLR